MKFLDRLERRWGKFAIPNLMLWIVGGQLLVFVITWLVNSRFYVDLMLLRGPLLRGEIWRLVTFMVVPEQFSIISFLISCYCYYYIGAALERYWGSFRFNMFIAFTMLGAIISCLLVGYGDNAGLFLGLLLAFSILSPNTQFYLFFLVPIKAKWLGWISVGFWALDFLTASSIQMRLALVLELLAVLVFFGPQLLASGRAAYRRWQWQQKNRGGWNR